MQDEGRPGPGWENVCRECFGAKIEWAGMRRCNCKSDDHADVERIIKARNIMRAILDSDERGQGINFHEAMDAAEAFCCDVEARYAGAMKELPHAD